MLRRILLGMCLILGLASAAAAERRVALVLGVEDYKNIRPLDNPVADARAMETLLEGLGFEVFLETDRDLRRMRRALEDFREDAAGADVALLFFAGHGVALEGVNYLLPTDADATSSERLRETSLPLSEAQEVMTSVAKVAIVLLDACRDDPFAQGAVATEDGRGAAPLVEDPPDTPPPVPGLGRIGRSDGVLFAFAAAPGETASDGQGENSPFTSAMIRHLGTNGVELKSALTLVQQDVYDRSRGKQMPYIESGLPELVFISQKGDLPEREALLLKMADVTPEMRAEVEEVAAIFDMPLAPLYGAVLEGDLGSLPADQRRRKLEEAAEAYAQFQQGLGRFASSDPRVEELRAQAEEQLALGATETARELISEATRIDAEARGGIREGIEAEMAKYVERTLSEAASHTLNASAAQTDLRYDLAIGDLTRAVELYAEVQADMSARDARLAYVTALDDLGRLYSVTGDSNVALSVHMTRLDYVQGLAMAEPFDIGWTREVVDAMNSVGLILQSLGYMREAEEKIGDGLEMMERQVAAHPEDTDLSRSLQILLNRYGAIKAELNDLPGALEAHRRALQIAEMLLDSDPTLIIYMRDVMITQTNIGDVLREMGDYNGSRDAYDVSLRISQQLTNEFPDDLGFKQDLAVAYERLGDVMIDERDYDTALAIYLESVKLREVLQAADPGNVQLQRDFAVVWGKLGDIYQGLGDIGSSLMSHEQARAINTALVALDPANTDWMVNLSITLERIGQLYHDEGDYAGALAVLTECRDLRERIVTVDPSSLPRRRELGVALEKIGNAFAAMGDDVSALEVYVETYNLRRALVDTDPVTPLYQSDLAWSHLNVGDVLVRQADQAGARAEFEQAVVLFDGVVEGAMPSEWALLNSSIARNRLIATLMALDDPQTALALAEVSISLMEQIIAMDGDAVRWAGDMVIPLQWLGDAHLRLSDSVASEAAYRRMAEVAAAWSAADPYDTRAAANHAIALERIGDAIGARQDYAAARAPLEEAVAIRRWLVGQNPGAMWEHRGLAIVLQKLADTYFFANTPDPGRPLEEEALLLLRDVMAASPGDPWAVVDVVVALDRMASYEADATALYSEALDLLNGLIAAGGLPDPFYQQYVDKYREALGRQ